MSERARSKLMGPESELEGTLPPVRGMHTPIEIERIVVAGYRGRGVRFLGKVIAQAGMLAGHNVTWLPVFSPSIQGEFDHCTVLVSKEEIGSPLAGVPDIVLASDPDDFEFFKMRIKAGGLMVYDTTSVDLLPEAFRDDIRTIGVPVADLAGEAVTRYGPNMVLLGAFVGSSRLVDERSALEALARLADEDEAVDLGEQERRAFQEGLKFVRERRYMFNRYAYSIFMR